jgi:hypothetical protein
VVNATPSAPIWWIMPCAEQIDPVVTMPLLAHRTSNAPPKAITKSNIKMESYQTVRISIDKGLCNYKADRICVSGTTQQPPVTVWVCPSITKYIPLCGILSNQIYARERFGHTAINTKMAIINAKLMKHASAAS